MLGYNDLGMHCLNQDFSELMILPPFNTLHAQVIDRRPARPQIVTDAISVTYAIPGNRESATKTNFWDYAGAIFGTSPPPNVGLTGTRLAGRMAPTGNGDWAAVGIPLTPMLDDGVEDPFPLANITVLLQGDVVARTRQVVPVSWEIDCGLCHSNVPGTSVAQNILEAHDRHHGTDLVQQKPVACGTCHTQPELEPLGIVSDDPGNPTLSRAVHHAHAPRVRVLTGLAVKCYACHPGVRTQCLRDVHSLRGMVCDSCHTSMAAVADPARRPWVDEPRCGNCHHRQGHDYEQADTLYRNSKGHGGVFCAACHNPPHAVAPSREPADNVQATRLQGHEGTIRKCSVCHAEEPEGPFVHRDLTPVPLS